MLVLDRKRGQQVTIGRNVVVTVLDFKFDDVVRLQVECGPDLDVRHGWANDLDRLDHLQGNVCQDEAADCHTYSVILRRGEVLAIGEFLVCLVRFLRPGVLRIGFDGPRDVPVFRSELLSRLIEQGLLSV